VQGREVVVDGTFVAADASSRSRVPANVFAERAAVSLTVQDYLIALEQQNPIESTDDSPSSSEKAPTTVSTTDPDAAWARKCGTASFAYLDHYLIDMPSQIILGVEATPARFRQETLAARRMVEHVEHLGVRPESLSADKAYGSGEFLAWALARGIQPYVAVIDRRHQRPGRFSRDSRCYRRGDLCQRQCRLV
jgi:hypothetical protein